MNNTEIKTTADWDLFYVNCECDHVFCMILCFLFIFCLVILCLNYRESYSTFSLFLIICACKHWMVIIALIYQWELKLNIAFYKTLFVVDLTAILDKRKFEKICKIGIFIQTGVHSVYSKYFF